ASSDVLALREQVTNALQRGLLPALGASGLDLSVTKPKSQEAYELYLRSAAGPCGPMPAAALPCRSGRTSSASGGSDVNTLSNRDALRLLEKSVALDPGYAAAWVALGQRYDNEAELESRGDEMRNKSIAAFERAHQLDPELLSASTLLIE